jgi:peptidyl-prolyl cis-trans isomerase A (cyclophilin A)
MKMKSKLSIIICAAAFLLMLVGCGNSSAQEQSISDGMKFSDMKKQTEAVPSEKNRYAVIQTNMGTIKFELYEDRVPLTTGNFIKLAQRGFYDGIIFHRVINGFMIQGGDPLGNGTGGPGYSIKDEFSPMLRHDSEGIVSMANAGPDTGGSQFFITLEKTPWLDGKHAVFGKVVEGMDVVRAIGKVKTGANDKPIEPVVMEKVTISQE